MKQGNKYEIAWVDTIAYNGWHELEDISSLVKEYKIKSMGYFIEKTKPFTVIAQSFNLQSGEYGNILFIATKSIIKIKGIK